MNGLLLINKESGCTSHDVVSQVRKLYQMRQVGHGGTLDPMATGLLVIGLGKATKVLDYVANNSKEYIAQGQFGFATDTYDAIGTVTKHASIPDQVNWERVIHSFTGEIDQVPPIYSALKRDGKKLYEYAREGVEVKLTPRKITIYNLQLLNLYEDIFSLHIHCSSGTYIRSLINDIGSYLNSAATMTSLKRTSIGSLHLKDSYSLSELKEMDREGLRKIIIPMDKAITHLPSIELSNIYKKDIINGKVVVLKNTINKGIKRVYCGNDFMGIGTIIKEDDRTLLKIKKMLYQEPEWKS